MPAICSSATITALPAMKAALSTLTAATTRARRSAPAQACTAANVGTMNRPPAIASPARSSANRMPRPAPNIGEIAGKTGGSAQAPQVDQPRSIANTPSSTAPISVGSRMMRPAASQAARPEPIAIEIEKIARQAVTTSSSPPSTFLTSGGISESATAPTSQNQLVTSAPHQQPRILAQELQAVRGSRRGCSSAPRDRAPPVPVRGMSRLEPQHSSENTIISVANWTGSPPSLAARPPTMVPSRMAMKVAPSTSALPAGSSERARWSGRMPYLIGPNSERDDAEQEQRDEQERSTECRRRSRSTAMSGDADLGELEALRHHRLVVAVGELAAERGKEEVGRDEDRGGERDQRVSPSEPPIWNRIRKTSAFLRKLSLNAEKNWVQNRGAKRRVMSRDEDMSFSGGSIGPGRPKCQNRTGTKSTDADRPFSGRNGVKDDNLGERTITPAR